MNTKLVLGPGKIVKNFRKYVFLSGDRLRHLKQLSLLALCPELDGFWIKIWIQIRTWIWIEFNGIFRTWFKPLIFIDD
jgi:hypothetical protein